MMMGKEQIVQYVAASRAGNTCVLLDTEGWLVCVDLKRQAMLSRFPVLFDAGGHRCALDAAGTLVVTAAYRRYGAAAYALADGIRLWHRCDLQNAQVITYDEFLKRYVIVRDDLGAAIIDPDSSVTLREHSSSRQWYASPYEAISLSVHRGLELLDGYSLEQRHFWKLESFSALDACFSPSAVFISESAGPLRCFSLSSGTELWRLSFRSEHYLAVGWCAATGRLCGLRWDFEAGRSVSLDILSPETGSIMVSYALPPGAALGAFACDGRYYVSSDWSITSTETGERSPLIRPLD